MRLCKDYVSGYIIVSQVLSEADEYKLQTVRSYKFPSGLALTKKYNFQSYKPHCGIFIADTLGLVYEFAISVDYCVDEHADMFLTQERLNTLITELEILQTGDSEIDNCRKEFQ